MTIKNFNSCKETHPFFNKDKMSVFEIFLPFNVTCERRLSHSRNVNILHAVHPASATRRQG